MTSMDPEHPDLPCAASDALVELEKVKQQMRLLAEHHSPSPLMSHCSEGSGRHLQG